MSGSGQNACLMLSTALKSIVIIKKWNNECYILKLLKFKAHLFYVFFWTVSWTFWHLVGLDAKTEVNEHLKLSQPACYFVCTPLLLFTVTSKDSFMFKSVIITHATDKKLVTKGVLICLTTAWSKLQENISSHCKQVTMLCFTISVNQLKTWNMELLMKESCLDLVQNTVYYYILYYKSCE